MACLPSGLAKLTMTFDLCLSGWTSNDWSSQLKFALMTANPKEIILDTPSINAQKVEQLLKIKIKINVKDAAKELNLMKTRH